MIPGKKITLADGKDYIIPPLTFRQARQFDEDGTSELVFRKSDDAAHAKETSLATFRMIHAALIRNYPDAKLEDMEALLDPGLVSACVLALFGSLNKPEERVRGE